MTDEKKPPRKPKTDEDVKQRDLEDQKKAARKAVNLAGQIARQNKKR